MKKIMPKYVIEEVGEIPEEQLKAVDEILSKIIVENYLRKMRGKSIYETAQN